MRAERIKRLAWQGGIALAAVCGVCSGAMGQGPSFSCERVEAGSIEALICGDRTLSALDRKLAAVYAAAAKKALNEHPPTLKPEQRGWIKGRNACWQSDDRRQCVDRAYRLRFAELQARYRLVAFTGPMFYVCDGKPSNEVVATFFATDPPTLIAERGDSVSLMYLQSADGVHYEGRNERHRERQGEVLVTWGFGASEMTCRKKD